MQGLHRFTSLEKAVELY